MTDDDKNINKNKKSEALAVFFVYFVFVAQFFYVVYFFKLGFIELIFLYFMEISAAVVIVALYGFLRRYKNVKLGIATAPTVAEISRKTIVLFRVGFAAVNPLNYFFSVLLLILYIFFRMYLFLVQGSTHKISPCELIQIFCAQNGQHTITLERYVLNWVGSIDLIFLLMTTVLFFYFMFKITDE